MDTHSTTNGVATAKIQATSNGVASPADYLNAGLSIIPIRADGTKAPAVGSWKKYQASLPTAGEVGKWFLPDNVGVAIIHGEVSGGTELIDVDNADIWEGFCDEVVRAKPGLLANLTVIQTPRPGYHIVYRCETVQGNQKLASTADGKTLIETRGQGGYALAPGSPADCHETGRLYEHYSGPPLTELPTITPEERSILFRVAASFDEAVVESYTTFNQAHHNGQSPGDDFNLRADWAGILTPHGWTTDHSSGDKTFWRRPGKTCGWSATSGLQSTSGNSLFCCFSTSAHPFEGANGKSQCTSYTKFAAHAVLNHGGDFVAAAKQLASEGYGDSRPQQKLEDFGPIPKGEKELITFSRITSRELAEGDYSLEYLVKDTMVAGQPLIIAGPQKTLKTSFIIDLAISLATSGYFLGKLKVNRSSRVAVMTGESGLSTIQETAIRICHAAGVFLPDIEKLLWSEDLPKFGNAAHLDALERFLVNDAIEVLFIDPAYLTMPGADAGNVMIQGELLRTVSDLCRRLGVTMVLAHHTKRHTGRDADSPGELSDIAWSGFAEFARQWILINRREAYEPGTGEHRLWLSVGGSAGHSALWAVDVNEGVRSDESARKWEVEIHKPSEAIENAEEAKEAAKATAKQKQRDDDLQAVLKATAALQGSTGTKTAIKDAVGINSGRFNAAFAVALRDKHLTQCEITKGNNRKYDGYKLNQ